MIQLDRVFSLSLSQSGFTSAHLVCRTRATARCRCSKTFTRISGRMQKACMAHGKRSRNSISSAFNLFFEVRARDCTTFMLHDLADFYVESVTAHRIKRMIIHVFYNRWPKSNKTKIKTSLRAMRCFWGVSGGLTQLAYSAYREDQLWIWR